jgi:hypothetical protein
MRMTCSVRCWASTIISQSQSQENIESSEPLENDKHKKARQEFERSEHERSGSCGCGS